MRLYWEQAKLLYIKVWPRVERLAFLLAIALISVGFYFTFHKVTILQVYNEPVEVMGEPLRAGEALTIELDFCKFTDDTAAVTPELIGHDVPNRYLPTFISDTKKGCYNEAFTVGNVPLSAPSGTYTLRLAIEYNTNALHRQFLTIESKPFDVTAGKILYLP